MNGLAQTPEWLNDAEADEIFDFDSLTDAEKAKITAEIAKATGTPWLRGVGAVDAEETKETPEYSAQAEEDAVFEKFRAKDPAVINDPVLRGMAYRAYLRHLGRHGKLNNRF